MPIFSYNLPASIPYAYGNSAPGTRAGASKKPLSHTHTVTHPAFRYRIAPMVTVDCEHKHGYRTPL